MNYEVVTLEGKTVVGKSVVTSNQDKEMGQKIGALWMQLYDEKNGYYGLINNKSKSESGIGLYSDYTADGGYTVTVGCEVSKADNTDLTVKQIPAGKYAKFSVRGNMLTAVAGAWEEIWKMPLDRTFTGDFEEYTCPDNCPHKDDCSACEDCMIDIYIAIK